MSHCFAYTFSRIIFQMSQVSDIIRHWPFLPDTALSTMFSRSICTAARGSISLSLRLSNIPLHTHAPSVSTHLLKGPLVASTSWLLKTVPLRTLGCTTFLEFVFVFLWECDGWIIWWFYIRFSEEPPYCFPQCLLQFTFPPIVYKVPFFSTSLSKHSYLLFSQ